jgi:rubrerythrin
MLSQLIDQVLAPIRNLFSSARQITSAPQVLKGEINRAKQVPDQIKGEAKYLADQAKQAKADVGAAGKKAGELKAGAQGAAAKAKGSAGAAQAQVQEGKKAKKKMGLFGKKNVCPNCGQPQEKTWDKCPFCINMQGMMGGASPGGAPPPAAGPTGAYGATGFAAPPPGGGAQKTVMFQAGAAGGAASQLVGWVVPLKGPHRGELHTLKPQTVFGRDPTCDVCFNDSVMSSRHATIRTTGGKFILEDHSTNGTYVNDKRVTSHDLVDNDFIKFGNTLVKFKSLT